MILLTTYVPFVRTFYRVCEAARPCFRSASTTATITSRSKSYASITSTDSSSSFSSSDRCIDKTSSSPILNFYSTSDDEMSAIFKSIGQPTFRYKQVKQWVYEKGVVDFNQMNNLPSDLKTKLGEIFNFGSLKLVSEQVVFLSLMMVIIALRSHLMSLIFTLFSIPVGKQRWY